MFSLDSRTRKRVRLVTLASLGLCTVIVLGLATQTYVDLTMRLDESVNYWRVIRWPAVWWGGWVLLAPAVFELAWRRPIRPPDAWRNGGILLAGCLAASVIHDGWQVAWMFVPPWTETHDTFREAVEYHIYTSLYLNVFNYWAVVGVAHGFRAYQREHERSLELARMETELATARLDVLRMQLHPHFLFNTLNGISALMYRDAATADAMITRLSRLLRRALDRSDVHEVTLKEEMDFLTEYLAIERMRFDDGLDVHIQVEEGLDDVLVPTFVFQPLVENSIKHAVVPSGNRGRIEIRAHANGRLYLEVADDGPGLAKDRDPMTSGVGLSNLADRLERLYGKDHRIELNCRDREGLSVCLELPLRHSSPDLGLRHGQT